MNRKEFLKTGCGILALGSLGQLMEGCAAYPLLKIRATEGKIQIPLSEFTLQKSKLVRSPNWNYDLMVRQLPNGDFVTLELKCSHQDWALNAGKNGFHCTYHGSAFDLEGKVKTGPATHPLRQLKTTIENENVIINL